MATTVLHIEAELGAAGVARLKTAVDELLRQRRNGGASAGHIPALQPASAAAAAPLPPLPLIPGPAAAALPAADAAAARPPSVQGAALPPLQAAGLPPLVPAPPPLATVAPPPPPLRPATAGGERRPASAVAVTPYVAPPPPAAYAAPPPPAPAPAAAAPAAAAAAPAARYGGPSWQCVWTTDPAEHGGSAVQSLCYLPSVPGLPGGDGHAGWVVSSSKGLLNLWEASPSGGRGEASLMCMHSQGTDYGSVCMEAERGTGLLLGASQHASGEEWLTLHSLQVDSLLAFKSRCPMPHQPSSRMVGSHHRAVVSLHPLGGPLAECAAGSYGGAVVVWQVGSASRLLHPKAPKAMWKAHGGLITALHRSAHPGLLLFSGAADGAVHMWSLREKPNAPLVAFNQQGSITGVHHLNETTLVTAADTGRVLVWDVRQAAAGPVKFAVPDGTPIDCLAVSPFGDAAAVATRTAVYSVDLLDTACTSTQLSAGQLRSPVTGITWNVVTSEVLVGGGPGAAGSISVFRQQLPGYA
eukprot:scaffold10.g2337.t1